LDADKSLMTGLKALSKTLLILGASVLATGCARINTGAIVPGKTTAEEVTRLLGPPAIEAPTKVVPGEKVLTYPDGVNVQVNDGTKKVSAVSRKPKGDERFVQYWRHRWKGLDQHDAKVPSADGARGHAETRRQLVAKSAGMGVLYDSETGLVEKVVQFGTR